MPYFIPYNNYIYKPYWRCRRVATIYRVVERVISTGVLAAGTQLPTLRDLASSLGVNKNTIAGAYKSLFENGTIITDGRRGSIVARRHREAPAFALPAASASGVVALHNGNSDPAFLGEQYLEG
jgi:DNA-binding transcriptional MocR family regulator